ncbi:mitochondrial import inner membrane translocase subunit Tim29 [Coccinella septempunctata]|uniref:mitochondrial import inner membrane translocase subunit Tim29 n=1 Tax=Coccinella septempunctata TaxID=41139 RepID=UPI001D05F1A4|nr:mitochondrial import inner membrane translocase subunit Tim29 [Coccinella septempunctata]
MSFIAKRVIDPAVIQQKIKGTIVEKWMFYWKSVMRDYKDVVIGLKEEAKQKPKKAVAVITGFTFLGICAKTNPDLKSFRAKHIQSVVDISLVSSTVANPTSLNHLKYLEKCFNASLIRHQSFGLFSLIWVDTSSDKCKNYESTCEYMNWRYVNFHRQVVDVGFLGIWWVISRKMLDYDINY